MALLFLLTFGGLQLSAQLSGAYTINGTLPTGGTNFNSFSAAAAALQAVGISGPVTLTVAAGTGPYVEQVSFGKIPGSSPVNRITLDGNGRTLEFTPPANPLFVLRIAGTDYFTVKNLTINSLSTGNSAGILVSDTAQFDTIRNCRINLPLSTPAGSTCIGFSAFANAVNSPGYNATDFVIQDNVLTGGGVGAYLVGSPGAGAPLFNPIPGIQFLRNTVQDFFNTGLDVQNLEGAQIRDNDFSRPTITGTSNHVVLAISTGCFSSVIEANQIHDTYTTATGGVFTGIRVTSAASSGRENTIANNVIYAINSPANNVTGIAVTTGQWCNIFHNSIDLSFGASTAGFTRAIQINNGATEIHVESNIILVTRATNAAGNRHALFLNGAPTNIAIDRNVLFVSGTPGNNFIGAYNATNFATLANWQTANGGIYDQNSLETDPGFVSPATGNLTPTSAGINGMGVALGITEDIINNLRDPFAPDPGAFEIVVLSRAEVSLFARKQGQSVDVEWFVDQPEAVSSFNLSRKENNGAFEAIYSEPGGSAWYTFTDRPTAGTGLVVYRLSWTDSDGRVVQGPEAEVRFSGPGFELKSALLSESLEVKWATSAKVVKIRLLDLSGRVIAGGLAEGAASSISLSVPSLAAGHYLLEVLADGERVYVGRVARR